MSDAETCLYWTDGLYRYSARQPVRPRRKASQDEDRGEKDCCLSELAQAGKPGDDRALERDAMVRVAVIGSEVHLRDLMPSLCLDGVHKRIGSRREPVVGSQSE